MHTLVWGNQQPGWIEALPPAEQLTEIEEWFAAVAARYPDIDFIDVVNEPLHDPPDGEGDGTTSRRSAAPASRDGTGSCGRSAWRAGISRTPVSASTSSASPTTRRTHSAISASSRCCGGRADRLDRRAGARVLHARAHSVPPPTWISWRQPDCPSTSRSWTSTARPTRSSCGLSADLPGVLGAPGVRGITLWGFRPGPGAPRRGLHRPRQRSRAAGNGLAAGYVASTTLRPWTTTHGSSRTVTVGDSVSFVVDAAAPRRWRSSGGGTASRSRETRPPRPRPWCSPA